jgi:outer membrane protein TolC
LIAASKRLLTAESEDLNLNRKETNLKALQDHFDRMKKIQDIDQERFGAGRISIEDLAQAKYYRLEAEIWLERAKSRNLKLEN